VVIRKRTAVVATLAVLAVTVSACSSSGSSKPAASGGSSTSAAGSTAASPSVGAAAGSLKGQTFTILSTWTGGEQAAFQAVLNAFDKQTGAKGEYTSAQDEATALGTAVAGGTPPDIAILSLPGAIAQYATAGNIKPITDSGITSAVSSNFATEWGTLGSFNGKLYGVPVDASDKSTIWYNANLWKAAGLSSTPTTWTQFLTDAKTLAASGVNPPISVGGGDGWTLTDWFENIYIRTAGLADYDKLTHHEIPWTDPSVTTALNTLKAVWTPALIGSASKAAATPFPASVDNVFKKSPTSGIVYEASFVATTITGDKDPSPVGTVAKVFTFPSVNGSAPVLETAGDFAVPFKQDAATLAFLKYLASPAAAQILVSASGSGFLSANKNLATSAYPDATSKQLAQAIVGVGNNFRFDMSDQSPAAFGGTAGKGEWEILQQFLESGNVASTQSALEAAAKQVTWTK
jgi:alpha-glucoside transport system substrate-binding protein